MKSKAGGKSIPGRGNSVCKGCESGGRARAEHREFGWVLVRGLLWNALKKTDLGTSLVAQWLRIRLPVQGTRVQALVREDPTCHGASKPVRHNYGACALEPMSHNY